MVGVADTHAALWYLFADTRLSAAAKTFVDQAAITDNAIGISPISLAETGLSSREKAPAHVRV